MSYKIEKLKLLLYDQLLTDRDYEDMVNMTRNLIGQFEKWGRKLNLKETKYMTTKKSGTKR